MDKTDTCIKLGTCLYVVLFFSTAGKLTDWKHLED